MDAGLYPSFWITSMIKSVQVVSKRPQFYILHHLKASTIFKVNDRKVSHHSAVVTNPI
jgi:hypothetical protein